MNKEQLLEEQPNQDNVSQNDSENKAEIVENPAIQYTSNNNPSNNETRNKANSKTRSKNERKRPPNCYVLFCNDHRDKVKSQNPSFSVMEVSQALSKMWEELDPSKVEEYKNRAKESFDIFKQDNPDYHYKTNKKSSKKITVRYNHKDAFQIVNHLFQTSPFMLQQMLLEKDKKGHLDITKMFSLE